jgi:hypothetical protein
MKARSINADRHAQCADLIDRVIFPSPTDTAIKLAKRSLLRDWEAYSNGWSASSGETLAKQVRIITG